MAFRSRHLDPDELGAAVWETPAGRVADHLAVCEACRRERDAVMAALSSDRTGAYLEADEAFAPVDLARQRQSIQQRIARLGMAARVLPFRGGRAPDLAMSGAADRRWIVAAAAAGLALGLVVGRGPWTAPSATADADTAVDGPRVALVETLGGDVWRDDPLLSDVEEVVARETWPEFGALDELTPIADEGR